jgi:hypothetical protein
MRSPGIQILRETGGNEDSLQCHPYPPSSSTYLKTFSRIHVSKDSTRARGFHRGLLRSRLRWNRCLARASAGASQWGKPGSRLGMVKAVAGSMAHIAGTMSTKMGGRWAGECPHAEGRCGLCGREDRHRIAGPELQRSGRALASEPRAGLAQQLYGVRLGGAAGDLSFRQQRFAADRNRPAMPICSLRVSRRHSTA